MRRIVTLVSLIGILIALPVVQAMAVEQQPKVGPRTPPPTAPAYPTEGGTGAKPSGQAGRIRGSGQYVAPPTEGGTTSPLEAVPWLLSPTNRVSLGCYIDTNGRQIYVGNPRAPAIRKGTLIFFSGKVDNGDMYSGRVPALEDIPPHLFRVLMYNPRFDPSVPCKAWLELPRETAY